MPYRNVKEILLISLSCIGDVLLTTPVMKALKDNFPGANLTVVAGASSLAILERHEFIDHVVVFENKGRHRGISGGLLLAKELRVKKYDLVVDLRNTAIPYVLRARHRITAHGSHLRNREAKGRHAIDRHLDVLEAVGITAKSREMIVTVPGDVMSDVEIFLKKRGLADVRLAAVYPGAGSTYKMYPIAKMIEVLRMLEAEGAVRFAAIGSKEDRAACEEIARALPGRVVSVAGELDLLRVGALLKKCAFLISNDSGPMHLGAAVGTPVVAIFGPTDADRYGPRGAAHRIVWRREGCNPCKAPECGKESCVGLIPPEDIARAAADVCGFLKVRG